MFKDWFEPNYVFGSHNCGIEGEASKSKSESEKMNKLASLEAKLVQNSALWLSNVECRAYIMPQTMFNKGITSAGGR